ncbi:MAG TPA: STAS domain-containing protein [Roseiflexaceae bacterium]|nr:STAS domain-containing protein [Roseiflexaceae bacterium]
MSEATRIGDASQDEIGMLRQQLAEAQQARQEAERRAMVYQALLLRISTHIAIWHLEDPDNPRSFRLKFVNYQRINLNSTIDMQREVGRQISEIFPSLPLALLQRYREVLRSGLPASLGEMPFSNEQLGTGVALIRLIPLPDDHLSVSLEDITERKQAEEALVQSLRQEETIRAQQAALAELSTPLIPISDQVMVMPLIGAIDSHRAQQVIETLLAGISRNGAQVAILDITGVPVVDTQVANILLRVAQSARLLGARVVLTGIRPEVAQTLVGLGADLAGVTTLSTLQRGIAYATQDGA